MLQHSACWAATVRSSAVAKAVWLLQSLSRPDPSASKHRKTRLFASFRAGAFSTALLRYGETGSPKPSPTFRASSPDYRRSQFFLVTCRPPSAFPRFQLFQGRCYSILYQQLYYDVLHYFFLLPTALTLHGESERRLLIIPKHPANFAPTLTSRRTIIRFALNSRIIVEIVHLHCIGASPATCRLAIVGGRQRKPEACRRALTSSRSST